MVRLHLPSRHSLTYEAPAAEGLEYRSQFHHDLAGLEAFTRTMATHARLALEDAIQALQTSDLALCEAVVTGDDQIDDEYLEIERRAIDLLGRQQPVASDLRLLATLMHTALHLERIADMAVNIAEATRSAISLDPSAEILTKLEEMGDTATFMTNLAIDALTRRDPAMCKQLPFLDDRIDGLNRTMINHVLHIADNPARLEWALRMFQVSRYLERAADHALDIAEQAWFLITGELRELD